MHTLRDGTVISDRKWEELLLRILMGDLRANCCTNTNTEYVWICYPWLSENCWRNERNEYNFQDVRMAEEYITVENRVYKPAFEFIRHRNKKHRVPVFLETCNTLAVYRESLFRKYYDLCLSCREFAVLCGYGMFGEVPYKASPDEICCEITETIEEVFAKIKNEKTEHDAIRIILLKDDCYRDEYGIPDCEVMSLRAFHLPKEKNEADRIDIRAARVHVDVKIDSSFYRDGMFCHRDNREEARKESMAVHAAFPEIEFSLDKRHHFKVDVFLSSHAYSDGILSLESCDNPMVASEVLLRYLRDREPDEIKVTRKPVFAESWSSLDKEENRYIPLAQSPGTEIVKMTIEYAGKTYRLV